MTLSIPFDTAGPASQALSENFIGTFRGRRSRNKVSVGEPAEGSMTSAPSGRHTPLHRVCKPALPAGLARQSRTAREGSYPGSFKRGPFRFYPPRTPSARRLMEVVGPRPAAPSTPKYFFRTPKEISFNDGSLGSRNDEERRETRYVM